MIYISYYTSNTPYEQVIQNCLLPSLKTYGLKYDIEAIEDKGSWQANTGYKCVFVKKMLQKHNEPVVFLDADAVVTRNPALFDELNDYDIAFHWLDWYLQWRGKTGDKRELLSGTMMFNPTKNTFNLLDEWIYEVKSQSGKWEQRVLQEIIERKEKELQIYNLPASYCAVILHNKKIPSYIKAPVIVHTQASRKYKYPKKS